MEGEHWRDVLWHSMVGPCGEVILYNLQWRLSLGGQLEVEWNGDESLADMRGGNGTTYNEDEYSDGVVGKDGFILQDDLEGSVLLRSSIGPVLTALDPCTLNQVRYHDNGGGTCLPHQTPKIHDCPICWTCGE